MTLEAAILLVGFEVLLEKNYGIFQVIHNLFLV